MARMESKSVSVAPAMEQEAIEKHELFGWTLLNSQEVLSKESHLKEEGGDLWNVTTTTNYVKLVFQRNLEMPQIAEIKKLEEKYWNNYEIYKNHPSILPGKFVLIAGGLMIGGGIAGFSSGVGSGIACIALGLAIFAARQLLRSNHPMSFWGKAFPLIAIAAFGCMPFVLGGRYGMRRNAIVFVRGPICSLLAAVCAIFMMTSLTSIVYDSNGFSEKLFLAALFLILCSILLYIATKDAVTDLKQKIKYS